MKVAAVILFLLLMFSGCSTSTPKISKPTWLVNPNQNGFSGSIGMADIHYKGVSSQRKLAISRALDELALQKGVLVSLNMQKREKVKNDNLSSTMNIDSSYQTQNTQLTAHIEAFWQDKISKRIYIWLVLD